MCLLEGVDDLGDEGADTFVDVARRELCSPGGFDSKSIGVVGGEIIPGKKYS